MTLLLLALAACAGSDGSDPCFDFAPEPWDPVLEPDVRADVTTRGWTSIGGATVDDSADCDGSPCLSLTGDGAAALALKLNRGVPHTLSGTLVTDAAATVAVTHTSTDGPVRTLAEVTIPAGGDGAFSLPFVLETAGPDVTVTVTLDAPGTATLRDLLLVGERWAASADPPGGAVRLGVLVHVEDDPNFLVEADRWQLRATLLAGLSGTLAAHGARLGIQADATFIRGAALWDPDWIAARTAEGAGFSVHIHDEDSPNGVEPAIRDGRVALREAGVPTTDLNGGFGEAPWLDARLAGVTSLTAFKDPTTQLGLPHVQVQPWLVADGAGTADPEAFLLHDPEGPLLYLPGHDVREVEHARFPETAAHTLSQVLAHARDGYVNAWYWVLHVDGFGPSTDDPDALAAYLSGAGFAADLAAYDAFLTDTTDPLVASGSIVYDTPVGMATAWKDWNAACNTDDTVE